MNRFLELLKLPAATDLDDSVRDGARDLNDLNEMLEIATLNRTDLEDALKQLSTHISHLDELRKVTCEFVKGDDVVEASIGSLRYTVTRAWNTGGGYTDHGQRIAIMWFPCKGTRGVVYMVDLDRGLDYWYYDCGASQSEVMARYRSNRHDFVALDQYSPVAHRELLNRLESIARNVESVSA